MPTPDVRITRIESLSELEALEPAWWDLCSRASEPEPVTTPTWLLAWWRAFGADARTLFCLALWDGDRLVGLAPMLKRTVRHRGLVPMRRIELLATGEDEADEICSDYVGVIAERGLEVVVGRAVGQALADDDRHWDEVFLTQAAASRTLRELAIGLASRGIVSVETERGLCPHIILPKTWDDYVKTLDAKSRYLVTRALRELDKWAGPTGYKLRRVTTADELEEGRAVLYQLHATRWKRAGHGGVFVRDRFRAFHDDVMPKLLARGELDLIWLEVQGKAVAVLYNVLYANKVYVYQSGRTDDVPKNLRIGIAMNCVAVRDYIAKGFSEYDFLNGVSQYKRQMCAGRTHSLVTLRAASRSPRARLLEAARVATEGAARRAKVVRDEVRRLRGVPGAAPRTRGDDGDSG
ncbi:MAG: GNAT family N-acetyltransferase [Myxococcales bacterium]|nr:GNAT family N-acetyltransferase [Myxococcales bacterium]